jgi:hypothetical protein
MFIGETITGKFIYFNYAGGYHITNWYQPSPANGGVRVL